MAEVPAGTYRAKAKKWDLGETKEGKAQIGIQFALLDSEGTEGPRVTYYGYFTDKSYEYTVANMRTCGWRGDDLTNLEGIGDNEVEVVIEHEDYEGKTRAKIRYINGAGGGGAMLKAPMDDAKKRAFAAEMKAKIQSLGKVPPVAPKAPATKTSDDIPF